MSNAQSLHQQAMQLLDKANVARMSGSDTAAGQLNRQAYVLERQAAELLADTPQHEPTRAILYRSAAILALDCGEIDDAIRLIDAGLAGSPPAVLAKQLHELRDQHVFSHSIRDEGHSVTTEPNKRAITY